MRKCDCCRHVEHACRNGNFTKNLTFTFLQFIQVCSFLTSLGHMHTLLLETCSCRALEYATLRHQISSEDLLRASVHPATEVQQLLSLTYKCCASRFVFQALFEVFIVTIAIVSIDFLVFILHILDGTVTVIGPILSADSFFPTKLSSPNHRLIFSLFSEHFLFALQHTLYR